MTGALYEKEWVKLVSKADLQQPTNKRRVAKKVPAEWRTMRENWRETRRKFCKTTVEGQERSRVSCSEEGESGKCEKGHST